MGCTASVPQATRAGHEHFHNVADTSIRGVELKNALLREDVELLRVFTTRVLLNYGGKFRAFEPENLLDEKIYLTGSLVAFVRRGDIITLYTTVKPTFQAFEWSEKGGLVKSDGISDGIVYWNSDKSIAFMKNEKTFKIVQYNIPALAEGREVYLNPV